MQAIPTIYLPGQCEAALTFYRDAIGADILFQYKVADLIDPQQVKPGTGDRMLRAGLRIGDTVVYLSDGHGAPEPGHAVFQRFSLALTPDTREEAERLHGALADGGTVQIALRETAWATRYGTVLDRFGLHWIVETGAQRFAAA